MGRTNSRKAARHARITQDFFDQVPETSTGDSAKPLASTSPSTTSSQGEGEKAVDDSVNTARVIKPGLLCETFQALDLKDDYRQVACLLGERIYRTFERNQEAARDLLRHLFTTAYLTVDESTGKRVWRIDLDIKREIIKAIRASKFIGLFTSPIQPKYIDLPPDEIEFVIKAKHPLKEFDVIGIIVDYFLEWSVECANFLRLHPDLKNLDISLVQYAERHASFVCIGIIEIAAAIRTEKSIDLDPRPIEYFMAARFDKMAGEQNLFIQEKQQKPAAKNKGEDKVEAELVEDKQDVNKHITKIEHAAEGAKEEDINKDNAATTGTAAESTPTTMESSDEAAKDNHVNKDTITTAASASATCSNIAITSDDPVSAVTAGTRGLSIKDPGAGHDDPWGLRTRRSRRPAASVVHNDIYTDTDGITSAGDPFPNQDPRTRRCERLRARARIANAGATTSPMTAADASGTATPAGPRAGRRCASASTAGPNNASALPRDTPPQHRAKDQLYKELEDLVNTNFPSAQARRAAFAQARQRLLRSETVAVARGEQPLRATATRATQEALTLGIDDALNAVRQRRAAEAARMRATGEGTEANARAREQGFGFDIGGMSGWTGELEAMQIQALQRKKDQVAKKQAGKDAEKDGDDNKEK
ncbi:uncharacterized protein Z519_08277 [Cladophialophora bantiana CBS 173.52]|uniref:Uncharacterized protein n=1 Tax=Cladophialophora bantiana (strain ATCC 10958 / CBS 173.52 / CDC B-1940 / NIH 8579) TaxID=1442370 RepID=A0A0D2EMZ6_CLAB1|nr:uncharacterized protein Z519_08277 [Cladophialophora bantiana CBS 173.52]KIW91381.1 hypothetical protein Z519_08277 [Cladophialophora bantiana CBS 173.52]